MAGHKNFSFSRYSLIILIIIAVWFLYRSAFSAYFFQDDWFSFSISSANNLGQFLEFFKPRPDLIYYRPLGMQLPFFLVKTFFGINPLPFRIVTFIIHLLNGLIVYKLFSYFFRDKKFALLGAGLYLTSAIHFTIFFWAATFSFILAPTFYFGGFLIYLNNKWLNSWLIFLVGLLVNELLISLPLVILIWEKWHGRSKQLIKAIPFIVSSLLYLLFRALFAPISKEQNYQLLGSVSQLLINFRDYLLWSFNWPEEMHNQFVAFARLNPLFIREFWPFVVIFSLVTFIFIISFVVSLVVLRSKKKTKDELTKLFSFGTIWFVICLIPVVFFSQHSFAYYLPIPLFGLVLASLSVFKNLSKYFLRNTRAQTLVLAIVFLIWYVSALQNVKFNTHIHWAPRRAMLSKETIKVLQKKHPSIEGPAIVLIEQGTSNSEYKWTLGDQNALQVIYSNPHITTVYGKKEMLPVQQIVPKESRLIVVE